LALEKRGSQDSVSLPQPLQILSTPLCYTAWEYALQEHPDQQLHSVNDGIAKELCSLSYTSVDDVVSCILSLAQGSVLAKLDIKHAYQNIPVHTHDRRYLGMIWNDKVFIDAVLPFGLWSAPLIFSAVAGALLWIMQRRGATMSFHYLDDFITIGSSNSTECERNIEIMKSTCKDIG